MKKLLLAFLLSPTIAFCEQVITPTVNFGGGIDHLNSPSEIADNRAVDCQNMIGDVLGAASKRNGSKRYIEQALSTNPITSIYSQSVDMGTYTKTALIATTWNKVFVSTGNTNPVWKEVRGELKTHNQNFSFTSYKNYIVMTGDALTDPIFKYDIIKDSFSELIEANASTEIVKFRAKYVLSTNGYMVCGNIMDVTNELTGSTTYYGDRVYYSLYSKISSFTWTRYIDVKTNDGESISGMTEKGGTNGNVILIYKPSSVTGIFWTNALDLGVLGGDITVKTMLSGVGCISPKALCNIGQYDIVPTKSGIVLYDGGFKSRLNLIDELKPISTMIKPDYEGTIKNNTFQTSAGCYYKKRQWYVFAFNDKTGSPSNKNNRLFVYDINTGEWWPFDNHNANSFTLLDDESLVFGESNDGYVNYMDYEDTVDDSRMELSLDNLDSTATWKPSAVPDFAFVKEGSASAKITIEYSNSYYSSMTRINMFTFGNYPNGKQVSKDDDYISFKVRTTSIGYITSLRMDMQYEWTSSSFTGYFSSVTLSSANLASDYGLVNSVWKEIKINISSFNIPSEWTDLTHYYVPYAKALTVYGIRFVGVGIATTPIYIDDLRVVSKYNPVNAYYISKQFDMKTAQLKDIRQLLLSVEKPRDSFFNIDVFMDYGDFSNTKLVSQDIPKEIFVCRYKGMDGVTKLKSEDFTYIDSTRVANSTVYDYIYGCANSKYLLMADNGGQKLILFNRNDMDTIVSSIGSLGDTTTSYNTITGLCFAGDDSIVGCDNFNDRLFKVRIKDNKLLYDKVYGTLGFGTTNYNAPTDVTCDKTHCWVADDGNLRIVKMTLSSFGYVSESRIEANNIPCSTIRQDQKYIYIAYHSLNEQPYFQDIVLEKRNKGDMSLVQRKILRPKDSVEVSTYSLNGNMDLLGKYIFVSFSKVTSLTEGKTYTQKLLKDGFDLIDEYTTDYYQFSVIGDGESYKPENVTKKIDLQTKEGTYIQLKYYDKGIVDNHFKLQSYSFAVDPKPYEE